MGSTRSRIDFSSGNLLSYAKGTLLPRIKTLIKTRGMLFAFISVVAVCCLMLFSLLPGNCEDSADEKEKPGNEFVVLTAESVPWEIPVQKSVEPLCVKTIELPSRDDRTNLQNLVSEDFLTAYPGFLNELRSYLTDYLGTPSRFDTTQFEEGDVRETRIEGQGRKLIVRIDQRVVNRSAHNWFGIGVTLSLEYPYDGTFVLDMVFDSEGFASFTDFCEVDCFGFRTGEKNPDTALQDKDRPGKDSYLVRWWRKEDGIFRRQLAKNKVLSFKDLGRLVTFFQEDELIERFPHLNHDYEDEVSFLIVEDICRNVCCNWRIHRN